MSTTDIIARLKLNAEGFSTELTRQLGDVERRFGKSGSVIGRNISDGIGGGLQEAASRVPVLGNALTGLSGSALGVAASVGVMAVAVANGMQGAEEYAKAVKGLGAVLDATGNKTGLAKDQLVEFAAELEGRFAMSQEEIIAAEKALASFDGVAGSTFKRAVIGAADMAAVFGGDLSSNTEKVGLALQNLAQGNVEGLGKAFKFLGTDTLESVKNLAELGQTAQAQELLLSELEKRVGGSAESQAGGLSGAFFRLTDAIGDANRAFVEQSGLYDAAVAGLDLVAEAVGGIADNMRQVQGLRGMLAEMGKAFAHPIDYIQSDAYRNQGRVDRSRRVQGLDEDPLGLNSAGSWDAFMARRSAQEAYANRANRETKKTGKSDAEKAAERALEQEQRLTAQISRTRDELAQNLEIQTMRAKGLDREADMQEALYRLYRQFPGVDRERLRALEDLTRQQVELNAAIEAEKELERGAQNAQKVSRRANDELARRKEEAEDAARAQIADLADYYETLFGDGVGSIWKQFKREGTRAIAELAAAYTLALLSGQKPTLDGIVGGLAGGPGSVFSSQGGGLFGQAIGGVLSGVLTGKKGVSTAGGAGVLPGDQPGIPQVPSGAFDIGSFLSGGMLGGAAGSMFGGSGLGSMAGGALGQVAGKELLGALGKFAGPVGSIVGGILGGLLGGAFKKTKKGVSTLGFVDDGELGVVSTRGNSSSRKQASISGANNVADALSQIAEQLGGELGGTISTSIGIRKKSYRVDTTGQGRLKGAGVLDFGQDEKAAIEAAIRDALSDGVITGISAASRKILASGKDLEKAIEMAADIESIPKRLKAIQDPLGAAIDALNDKWGATIDALEAGGASAEQWADAQKLYQLELDQVKESTGSAAKSLKAFLDDLNFGSSSPLSLRDQEAAAKAALQPFLTQINSGAAVDQAAYQSAAQAFLDIERQIYGSTDAFFQQFDAIQAATSKAIATIENVQPIAESPFVKATAEATQQTANATQATAEILSQQTQQLSAILARLQQMGVSGMAGFIGSARGFT